MPPWEPDPTNLNHARINRLLRPLRNRCHALLVLSTPAATTTYAAPSRSQHPPPLDILSPPVNLGLRTHFDKSSIPTLELSRKVYAVRDAYKDIILKAESRTPPTPSTVPSLSSICSIIIGENMPSELQKPVEYLESLSDPTADMYNEIPLQYRGWTLASHALSIILEVCPHTPTLLIILLDLVLLHKLFPQAKQLLATVLAYAISPSTSGSPPLCHPAHSTFLEDLRLQWTSASFPDVVFLKTLSNTLHEARNIEAWQCKSLSKLVKSASRTDISWMLHLLCNLTDFIFEGAVVDDGLLTKLSAWIKLCYNCYMSPCSDESRTVIDVDIYQLIIQGESLGFNQRRIGNPSNSTPLQDISSSFVSIATRWLSFSNNSIPLSQVAAVVNMLQKVKPSPSTYKDVVQNLYSTAAVDDCCSQIQSLVKALRSHRLLQLEASLFACALHYIDEPKCERSLKENNTLDQVMKFKQKLLVWVEDAEKRCFGPSVELDNLMPQGNGSSRHSLPHIGASGGWIWESSMGCWFYASPEKPSKKRRMTDEGQCRRSKRERHSDPPRRSLQDITYNLEGDKAGFKSLLSIALSNRVDLHSDKADDSDIDDQVPGLPSDDYDDYKCSNDELHAPSDDTLDLFNYNTSSPIKC